MAHQQAEGLQEAPEVKQFDSGWMEKAVHKIAVNKEEAIKVLIIVIMTIVIIIVMILIIDPFQV